MIERDFIVSYEKYSYYSFKHQSHKMVKHTQTIRQQIRFIFKRGTLLPHNRHLESSQKTKLLTQKLALKVKNKRMSL